MEVAACDGCKLVDWERDRGDGTGKECGSSCAKREE